MAPPPVAEAVKKYFLTTTLHGFKYMVPRFYVDRLWWCVGGIASASFAGLLCSLLWRRFANLPALLAMTDISSGSARLQYLPLVAVCQPPEAIIHSFLVQVTPHDSDQITLSATFGNAIRGLPANRSQINYLEYLFRVNHVTLVQVLNRYSAECYKLVAKCRWQGVLVPCETIFSKKQTREGVCCVADPDMITNITIPKIFQLDVSKKFDMVLDSHNASLSRGFVFYTKYKGEEWIWPRRVKAGFNYVAHIAFTVEEDNDDDNLISDFCVSTNGYSKRQCLISCVERHCGCSDPFRLSPINQDSEVYLPQCRLQKISCLRNLGFKDDCKCLPTCEKVVAKMILESSPMRDVGVSIDPLYSQLDTSVAAVVRVEVNVRDSKVFSLIPTESWLTLLSSLGGVFNMFLGVGLFSALELLFFLFVKLPSAMRRK